MNAHHMPREREKKKAGRKRYLQVALDSQNVIISILRFSMKDVSTGEILQYALDRILSVPFIPLEPRGCIFLFDEQSNSLVLSARAGGGKDASCECCRVEPGRCRCGEAAVSGKIRVSRCPRGSNAAANCFIPIVYRNRTLGVINLCLKSGDYYPCEEDMSFFTAAGNTLAGVLRHKSAERELISLRRELGDARRLADIGALAAAVAHELRSPLGVIKMAAANLRRKVRDPSLERHLVNIDRKIFESDRIISNLLFYSKLKQPAFETVRIYDIIVQGLEESRGICSPGRVSVRKYLKPVKNVYMRIDPLQIREVFTNILANAFESVGEACGSVEIKAETAQDSSVAVVFSDSGGGIGREELANIFSPFFTTKARGNGLGLTVSNHIMKMHGGRIEVESEKGKGSVFRVVFPPQATVPENARI